jgi:hypothetical protein
VQAFSDGDLSTYLPLYPHAASSTVCQFFELWLSNCFLNRLYRHLPVTLRLLPCADPLIYPYSLIAAKSLFLISLD